MPLKQTPANFRRSGSNVYKIDADELRQFERDPVRRTMFTRRQKPPHFQAVINNNNKSKKNIFYFE